MANIVYGPSGIGKTTAVRLASLSLEHHHFISLDQLIDEESKRLGYFELHDLRAKRGIDEFLQVGINLVTAKSNASRLVVDAGAGCFDAGGFEGWLRNVNAIANVASVEIAYNRICRDRARNERRTLDQCRDGEFSERCDSFIRWRHTRSTQAR